MIPGHLKAVHTGVSWKLAGHNFQTYQDMVMSAAAADAQAGQQAAPEAQAAGKAEEEEQGADLQQLLQLYREEREQLSKDVLFHRGDPSSPPRGYHNAGSCKSCLSFTCLMLANSYQWVISGDLLLLNRLQCTIWAYHADT